MVFMKCHECNSNEHFQSIDALQVYFSINHPTCETFTCVVEACNRTFNMWNSFRKHLRKKHNMNNRFDECKHQMQQDFTQSGDPNVEFSPNIEYFHEDIVREVEIFENILPHDFHILLKKQANILISKLNTKPGVPRNQVDSVIDDISTFLDGSFLKILKQKVINTLQTCYAKNEDIRDIEDMFQSLSNPFHHLRTEHKRIIHFQSTGAYIPPETYDIDCRMESKNTEDGVKIHMTQITGQHIPLRNVLKKFFELPDALNSTIQYMQNVHVESDTIYNFIQCQRWKTVTTKFKKSDIVLPLIIYYDDWEPNNPLGPHSEKIGAVYATVACLPPECQSKLDNIFLTLLFHCDDRKHYGNKKTFSPLIDELIFLETTGIQVNIMAEEKKIYFVTGLLTGDNLGVHSMCGFVESFSANFMCRFCKVSKIVTEVQCIEDKSLLRTSENYYNDLAIKNTKLTGIKEECVFNVVPSINIIEMPFVDEMHDCLEGVAHYSMIAILKHFLQLDRLFLEMLNCRMSMFNYGPYDSLNKPPIIIPETLEKNKLKMTASEMILFVRLFGIFVGDVVHEKDEFWQLYLLLHDIFDIIQARKLPSNIGDVLQILIKEHHELYLKITRQTLKPKHHFLLHYSTIFTYIGPFANISCMRFEAMHKRLKAYCTASMSRKNLLLSLAIKFQLALCYRFTANLNIVSDITTGPGDICDLSQFPSYSFFKFSLPTSFKMTSRCFYMKWVEWKNIRYKLGFVLIIGVDSCGDLRFGRIKVILLHEGEPLFICSPIFNIGFNSHIRGYEIECNEDDNKWFCIKATELLDYNPLYTYKMANREWYIVLKSFL